jgi:hypothetical protein
VSPLLSATFCYAAAPLGAGDRIEEGLQVKPFSAVPRPNDAEMGDAAFDRNAAA